MEQNKNMKTTNISTYTKTFTFGDRGENHIGNQIIGNSAPCGFSTAEIEKSRSIFEAVGYKCESIDLRKLLDPQHQSKAEKATLLIVRNGVSALLNGSGKTPDDLDKETQLKWDQRYFSKRHNKVVQAHAHYNLCFDNVAQQPNYEEKRGTIVAFSQVPCLAYIRARLPLFLGEKAKALIAEGNLYHNVEECYIRFHGDAERRIVVGLRIGASMDLYFQWFHRCAPMGQLFRDKIHHGDLYIFSEKAVGTDYNQPTKLTLRHAAGPEHIILTDLERRRQVQEINKGDKKETQEKQKKRAAKRQKKFNV